MDFYKTLASSGLFFYLFLLFSLLSLSGDNAYATSHNRQINFIIIVEAKKDQKIEERARLFSVPDISATLSLSVLH